MRLRVALLQQRQPRLLRVLARRKVQRAAVGLVDAAVRLLGVRALELVEVVLQPRLGAGQVVEVPEDRVEDPDQVLDGVGAAGEAAVALRLEPGTGRAAPG
jgi:hypothetical protein